MNEVFQVESPFEDIASLAQGYMNRADGERLLLPLSQGCELGSGVRFVVLLADGTPAFAGAGTCTQVSDLGEAVPPEQRFETLLDALQLDERSRPVYDYIVAVRAAAYTQAAADGDVALDAEAQPIAASDHAELMPAEDEYAIGEPAVSDSMELSGIDPHVEQANAFPQGTPSFIPAPIPTGLLMRPARAARWQPLPPRRPTPRPASGLFRYPPGALPMPARPPRPDLDPEQQVRPAARP